MHNFKLAVTFDLKKTKPMTVLAQSWLMLELAAQVSDVTLGPHVSLLFIFITTEREWIEIRKTHLSL